MTYYKYAERQVDTRINWAEVGKEMSDMLLEERKLRESKRQEIDAASRQFGETLSNAPTGTYDAGNTFILEFAEAAQEERRMQDHFLKTGQMNLKDYTIGRQNIQSGASLLFDLQKEYQAEYADKMARWEGEESAFLEVWQMEQAEGLANLRDSRAYINPTNGVVSVGKLKMNEETGMMELDPNQNNYVTVNELNKRLKMKYNRFNIESAAENATNQLGALEVSTFKYASAGNINQIITDIDAKKHNFGLEGETWAAGYKEWEEYQVGAMMINPNNVASVLTDRKGWIEVPDGKGGTEKMKLTFTYDKAEYDDKSINKGQLIYLDRSVDANGKPVFTEDQEKIVEQQLKLAIRANIDVKKQIKQAGATQFPPSAIIKEGKADKSQIEVANNLGQLWYGDEGEISSASNFLLGLINQTNPKNKALTLDRNQNNVTITYEDGTKREFPFRAIDSQGGLQTIPQDEWITGAITEFTEIDDVNDVLNNSGYIVGKELSVDTGSAKYTKPTKPSAQANLEAHLSSLNFKADDMNEDDWINAYGPALKKLGFEVVAPTDFVNEVVVSKGEGENKSQIKIKTNEEGEDADTQVKDLIAYIERSLSKEEIARLMVADVIAEAKTGEEGDCVDGWRIDPETGASVKCK